MFSLGFYITDTYTPSTKKIIYKHTENNKMYMYTEVGYIDEVKKQAYISFFLH